MSAILNSLNAQICPFFQPILMKLVSKSVFYGAFSYKTYLFLMLRLRFKASHYNITKTISSLLPNRSKKSIRYSVKLLECQVF